MALSIKALPKISLETDGIRKKLRNFLPSTPGVYFFCIGDKPIYIGKANSLIKRLLSYYSPNLPLKTQKMLESAEDLRFVKVNSEFEALLLESELIRRYQPQYNVISKDDKHPLYIKITNEDLPRVLTVRKNDTTGTKAIFGPFPSSANVNFILKNVRKIFPYSDHKVTKRRCLYSHIGLCSPCPSEIAITKDTKLKAKLEEKYLKNIKRIRYLLSGKINLLKRGLTKEMKRLSKSELYEEAEKIRKQVERLDYITRPRIDPLIFLENPNLFENLRERELNELKNILALKYPDIKLPRRIECYDVAHLAGTWPAASMVTFTDASPNKSFYRNFRIKKAKGGDDVSSLFEVITRRRKYFATWGRPDLIIVDGGKPQLKAFRDFYEKEKIPVVGLAKRFETLVFFDMAEIVVKKQNAKNLLQRVRDEAHRFARRYHHHLVKKGMLSADKLDS